MTAPTDSLAYANELRKEHAFTAQEPHLHAPTRRRGMLSRARALAGGMGTRLHDTGAATAGYVQRNPLPAVGIAAGIGFVAGLILKRW